MVTLTFSEAVTKCKKTEDVTTFKSTVKLYLLKMYCFASIFITSQGRRVGEGPIYYPLPSHHSLTWRDSIAVMQLRCLPYNFDINVCN